MWRLQLSSCQLDRCGYLSHLSWHLSKAFCDSLGLTQSVNFPTRITTNGTLSLLDLILSNLPENICCSSSAPIGSSDHVLVKVDISLCYQRTTSPLSSLAFHSSRLAGSPSSHQTSRLASHRYFLQHQLILGILSKKLALSHAQIYPLLSSVVLPFLPPLVP